MADMSKTIYKLQTALKQKGIIVCISTIQFYSSEQDRYIKMYKVMQNKKELINTASQIKVVRLLNDLWQEVQNETGNR